MVKSQANFSSKTYQWGKSLSPSLHPKAAQTIVQFCRQKGIEIEGHWKQCVIILINGLSQSFLFHTNASSISVSKHNLL
jgi:hypothetical protein